jgi:hypothetical protein
MVPWDQARAVIGPSPQPLGTSHREDAKRRYGCGFRLGPT